MGERVAARLKKKMGLQLSWLERTPDKREVDGSIPFEPTMSIYIDKQHIEKYIDEK